MGDSIQLFSGGNVCPRKKQPTRNEPQFFLLITVQNQDRLLVSEILSIGNYKKWLGILMF